MKIAICYASTEGQTRKIARFCAAALIDQGHSVEVIAASDANDMPFASFDAAILAGSVHLGHVQSALATVATSHAAVLNARPTLFLQVSLAVVGDDAEDRAEIDRIAQAFCEKTGWQPGEIHQIAGAFRFSEYDFFRSWAMRWVAAQKGQKVDPHGDTEYTDWDGLRHLMERWPEDRTHG